MKKLIYVFLIASVIISSCKKEEDDSNTPASIVGLWDFTQWDYNNSAGYYTNFPNGQVITDQWTGTTIPGDTTSEIVSASFNFMSDGMMIQTVVEFGFPEPSLDTVTWILNGNSLILDNEDAFTVTSLTNSNLVLSFSDQDTNLINDTVFFSEDVGVLYFNKGSALFPNTQAKQIQQNTSAFFDLFIHRKIRK